MNKYECHIIAGKNGHTRAECGTDTDTEDSYIIEPDFENFLRGGLAISRQFGPNETDVEADKNVHAIVIESRDIVDKFRDFLNSTRQQLVEVYIDPTGFTITYIFERESHGWLRVVMEINKGASTTDILIHKDVVPSVIKIVNENFT